MSVVNMVPQEFAHVAAEVGPVRSSALLKKLLHESEARCRSLTTLSRDLYWEQDESFRFTSFIGSDSRPSSIDTKHFLGTACWDCGAVPTGGDGSWDAHRAVLLARQSYSDFIFKRVNSSGELFYISSSGEPIFDEAERFRGYRGTARDVTRKLQRELRRALEHAVTRLLGESIGITEAAPQILRVIGETLGCACGARWEVEATDQSIHRAETWGVTTVDADIFFDDSRRQLLPTLPGGLKRRAWREGSPQWIRDVTQEPTFRRASAAREAELRSAFAFPIKLDDAVIGIMEFFSREIYRLEPELLDCMTHVGNQIGQFIQRTEAEESLRRFRAAMDVSADMLLLVDSTSLLYVDANETACRELGYSRDELLAMGPHEVFSISRDALAQLYARLIAGDPGATVAEGWYFRKNGSRMFVETNRRAVPTATGHTIVAVARDITGRKREEQLLRLEHAVTRSLAEADSAQTAIVATIQAVCETEGWDCGRYYQPDDKAGVMRFGLAWGVSNALVQRYIAVARDISYVSGIGLVGLAWQSGQPLWVPDLDLETRALQPTLARESGMHGAFVFPISSEGQTIGVLAFNCREVREPDVRLLQSIHVVGSQVGQYLRRKQSEEILRDSEERFRSLTNLSSDWFWEQDADFRFTRFEGRHVGGDGDEFESAIGKTEGQVGIEVEGGAQAHRALREAHQPFRDVVMCRGNKEGKRQYIRVSGEPRFNSSGSFKGYRGVGTDITEYKRAEQLLALEHAVNRCLTESENVQVALKLVLCRICESEGWECARYLRVDEESGVLRFGEAWSVPSPEIALYIEASRGMVYGPGVGLVGRVWQSGQPLWVPDIGVDFRVARVTLARETGMRGAFAIAIAAAGKTIGVLIFHSREIREPDTRLLQAMRVIGSQLGQFVQRKGSEQAALRLGRMFAALSETNDAILHAKSPEQLYQQVCNAAVNGGKFSSTTIFVADDGCARLKAAAGAGRVAGNLTEMLASSDESAVEGQGLVGVAFRAKRISISNDILNDDRSRPWHAIARQVGCRAAAALPLVQRGRSIAAVLIYDDEVNAFDDEIVRLLERMAENVSFALDNFAHEIERQDAQKRIQYLATHDGLTDLPNRVMFGQALNIAIQSARRYDRRFAVLFVDLDRFKIINDTLGHAAGDTLLKEISQRIKESLRSSDVAARVGGDEFVILLQQVSEKEQVAVVARKLLSILIRPLIILGQECRVTASIGVGIYPGDGDDEQTLMKNADIAMYFAKEQGKNNFQFYSREIKTQSLERLTLETGLRRALECEEFFLHYQAKLDLSNRSITGVEALLRWQHPELGVVPPLQFIPLAEETGLIVPIGRWVLQSACAQNVAWQRAGLPAVCMAVNLSPRQFVDDDLLHDLAAVFQETGMAPELLELEITESMVMGNVERAAAQLAAIKAMGVRLAIDDFGTGYSSLAQIKRFPIDTIKIDRSFIRDIPKDAEDMAITQAIIAMGKTLSLTVIAEGVETVEQESFLRDHKCDQTQGYYFSKPVSPDQFAALLLRTSSLRNRAAPTS